ncbi:FAD-dependent oxidoreductase, partial [Streptomyces sp. NPDC002920]
TPHPPPGRPPPPRPPPRAGAPWTPAANPPRVRPGAPLGTAVDQARLGAALTRIAATPAERLLRRPESAAAAALAARGLPARTIDGFLRPLLAALLCDPDLTTSSRCADLALRAFAAGRLCLPEGGAEMLPEMLARTLPPGTVHTGVRVTSVSTTSVTTAEHGEFRCRAVLVATDARAAAELLPGLRVPDFHPVTVLHHTTDEPPATGASLLLDADRGGPVAHTTVVSDVDPSRAPAGRALISSTVLGTPPDDVDTAVRMHLARLYGTSTARWETLAVHRTREAVPVMRPPHDLRRPVRLLAGLYVCGDHRDTSTVQGALHSAHRATAAILSDLGSAGSLHLADPRPTARQTQAAA